MGTYLPTHPREHHDRFEDWKEKWKGVRSTESSTQVSTAPSHTGRRFQSESTLQDIEIGQICRISMSR